MRPAGPVPGTCDKSTPASLALLRTAGEASGFVPEDCTDAATGGIGFDATG